MVAGRGSTRGDTVPTTDQDLVHESLSVGDCLRLLGSAGIGRLAYTQAALPAVRPVTFTLGGDDVLIPVHAGSPLVGAVRGAVVAFEADAYDAGRAGWTVTVVGPSRVVAADGPGGCVIAVHMGLIRGWRTDGVA
jgi:hypothetical protein